MVRNKYKAVRTKYNGINFDSKLEAKYAWLLDQNKKSGHLLYYLRQVPFDLPGGVKYRCDFAEFWKNGDVIFTDVKGFPTKLSMMKIKQVEALYPVNIQIISKIGK